MTQNMPRAMPRYVARRFGSGKGGRVRIANNDRQPQATTTPKESLKHASLQGKRLSLCHRWSLQKSSCAVVGVREGENMPRSCRALSDAAPNANRRGATRCRLPVRRAPNPAPRSAFDCRVHEHRGQACAALPRSAGRAQPKSRHAFCSPLHSRRMPRGVAARVQASGRRASNRAIS